MARVVLLGLWLVAALLLASAQLRVIPTTKPKRWRYVLAWVGCTVILGALLSSLDSVTGHVGWSRRLANTSVAATISAVGLGAGAWLTQRPEWTRLGRARRFLALVILHGLIVVVVAYPFI